MPPPSLTAVPAVLLRADLLSAIAATPRLGGRAPPGLSGLARPLARRRPRAYFSADASRRAAGARSCTFFLEA
ncbi:hypothetical protein ABE485_09655 [Achromobacter spanius]|uniref:hypothetical protein n=1 Tax=Achromobacter spanius TaxID=217203 RepID=UPI00320A78DE